MKINSLKLINYRNFNQSTLAFKSRGAVIYGKNGTGKTNILESICLFAFGKSFKNAPDTDLINFGADFFRIEAEFEIGKEQINASAAADKAKKIFKINNNPIKRISELYSFFKIVYLSPDDIVLISGSASKRRQFLNQALSQSNSIYLNCFRNYFNILKQRNKLLKSSFEVKEKKIWDEQFVKAAIEVTKIRQEYIKIIAPIIQKKYKQISSSFEEIAIKYKSSFQTLDFDEMIAILNSIEQKEIAYGHSLKGPHVDDIIFDINEHDSRKFGSQGQKRTLAIALKLAQAETVTTYKPILMFDDVLADLDEERIKNVLSLLPEECQIFIATPQNLTNLFDYLETIYL